MPRIQKVENALVRSTRSKLSREFAEELRSSRQSGQPVIEELCFPTGLIRVSVLWDRWEGVSSERRTDAIVGAYQIVEGAEYAEKVRLASGYTFLDALNSGMLPYQIILTHRPGDPVTVEQCRQAMIEEGASLLIDPENPPLLFGTEDQARAARERLVERLPGSEAVWLINRQIGYSENPSWDDEA